MNVMQILRGLSVSALLLATVGNVTAQEAKANAVRPEIGKPIQAAQELIKGKKGKDALAKARDADAVGGKSPYETYVVALVTAEAARLVGDFGEAAKSYEVAASVTTVGNKAELLKGAASFQYQAKNFAKAIEIVERYQSEGGTDSSMQLLLVQSLYLSNNHAKVVKILKAEVDAADIVGQAPQEMTLKLLAESARSLKDNGISQIAFERLVQYYPNPKYWEILTYNIAVKQGLSTRLQLDVLRTKKATNTLRTVEDYVDAIELSMQAGFPWEANKFLTAGYDAKLLGTGAEASRHQRLKDAVAKALTADQQALGQDDAKAAATGGDLLLNTGFNYALRGQGEKGVLMMEQALAKGTVKRPEEAKLHIGIAQVMSGQKARAVETLKGVTGKDGSADIARLWIVLAKVGLPD